MDREYAIRIVIFEYLLPMQRKIRHDAICDALDESQLNVSWSRYEHLGIFEELLYFSDRLLARHGFPTSYIWPVTMQHENGELDDRKNVSALIDSTGPLTWRPDCVRKADPKDGLRTFRAGVHMSIGVFGRY